MTTDVNVRELVERRGLRGRVAVVTGAGSGIGLSTVRRLAEEGMSVVVGDIDRTSAEEVAEQLRADGFEASAIVADVADENQVASLVASTIERYGQIDVLHNNAGAVELDTIGRDGDIRRLDIDVWDRTMAVNLRGVMLCTKHASPHMVEAGRGSIINTSSGSGLTGHSTRSAYGASKAGVNMFTQYTATAFGRDGIRCNAIAPGLIMTPAAERNLTESDVDMFSRHALTRRLGTPEDIAAMVAFLASDEAGFITGQVISVDGGALAHSPTYAEVEILRTQRDHDRSREGKLPS
ncbi:MAG: glucose 1-dehydrogenase [Ilumatobacteraceae bacterium]|nr:glucose 1-dehydrogenase [Ilumatobacteraceae bacterium]